MVNPSFTLVYSSNFVKQNWNNFTKRPRTPNFQNSNSAGRLRISNLHYNVMNDELFVQLFIIVQEIFSSIGPLRRCGIHWDKAGISKGTADVEYENHRDATAAVERLNGKEVEGMRIKVERYTPMDGEKKRIIITKRHSQNSGMRSENTFNNRNSANQ